VSARRGSGTGLAGECEFRRWTNHVKSGWRQPAVSREPRMQGKSQIASHRGFVQPQEQRASARRGSGTALAGECDSRRWTNHVRSGGREAAVGRETHLQERFRKVAGDWRRRIGERCCVCVPATTGGYAAVGRSHVLCCNRVRVTTGGLRPLLLFANVRSSIAKLAFSAVSERRAPGAAGVSPP